MTDNCLLHFISFHGKYKYDLLTECLRTEITKPSYLYHRKPVSTLHKRFYDYHRYLLGVVVSGQKSFGDLGPKDLFDVIGNTISRG